MSNIPPWVIGFAIGLCPVVVLGMHRSNLVKEMMRNDQVPAPEGRQVRWHIRHIRQDVALIAYLLMGILATLVWIAWQLTPR